MSSPLSWDRNALIPLTWDVPSLPARKSFLLSDLNRTEATVSKEEAPQLGYPVVGTSGDGVEEGAVLTLGSERVELGEFQARSGGGGSKAWPPCLSLANPKGSAQLLRSPQDRLRPSCPLAHKLPNLPRWFPPPSPTFSFLHRNLKADLSTPQLKALPGFPLLLGQTELLTPVAQLTGSPQSPLSPSNGYSSPLPPSCHTCSSCHLSGLFHGSDFSSDVPFSETVSCPLLGDSRLSTRRFESRSSAWGPFLTLAVNEVRPPARSPAGFLWFSFIALTYFGIVFLHVFSTPSSRHPPGTDTAVGKENPALDRQADHNEYLNNI